MRADRIKLEKLMKEREALFEQINRIDLKIAEEQHRCTCPDVSILPNGDRYCPDCLFTWSTDY